MEITTNTGCVNACPYCPQKLFVRSYAKRSPVRLMTFDMFTQCVDKLPRHVDVDFSGMSEPWLNPECTRMLLYAHEKGHVVNVYTTLVGMRLEDLDCILKVPIGTFCVHLPSLEGGENIPVTERYLEILGKLVHSGKPFFFLVFGKTYPDALRRALDGMTAGQGHILGRAGNITQVSGSPPPVLNKTGKLNCSKAVKLDANVLLPNGDVLLCCMDYGIRHVLGNLALNSYESLFEGEEFQRIRESLSTGSQPVICRQCERAYAVSLLSDFYYKQFKPAKSAWRRKLARISVLRNSVRAVKAMAGGRV